MLCHAYELIVRAKRTASLAVILEMKLGFMNTGPTCYSLDMTTMVCLHATYW